MDLLAEFLNMADSMGFDVYPVKASIVLNKSGIITIQQLRQHAPELLAEATRPIQNVPFFTIQSRDVVDVVLSGQEYKADRTRARESGTLFERNEDRQRLGGAEPIYVFEPHAWNRTDEVTEGVHGDLQELSHEMSAQWESLYGKYLIVLMASEDIPTATGHNGCQWVHVIPSITKDSVLAIYEICPFHEYWAQNYLTYYLTDQFREHPLHRAISLHTYEQCKYLIKPE